LEAFHALVHTVVQKICKKERKEDRITFLDEGVVF
jgi:hypothetical protein